MWIDLYRHLMWVGSCGWWWESESTPLCENTHTFSTHFESLLHSMGANEYGDANARMRYGFSRNLNGFYSVWIFLFAIFFANAMGKPHMIRIGWMEKASECAASIRIKCGFINLVLKRTQYIITWTFFFGLCDFSWVFQAFLFVRTQPPRYYLYILH